MLGARVQVRGTPAEHALPPVEPCVLVLFGASGDLTRRLLMPSLHGLACDGLLPERFAIVGIAMDEWSDEAFRERMTAAIETFSPWRESGRAEWTALVPSLHYVPGRFDDPRAYDRLGLLLRDLHAQRGTAGNVLFYLATPPPVFGLIARQLHASGLGGRASNAAAGWTRLAIEKPFGHDLASAIALDREVGAGWREEQIFRIDHYLGKETVRNLLAFRFANGIFEPVWNRTHVDHLQLTITETVGVEGRGAYYDKAGALRDMLQNHALQVIALLTMEPPASFHADAIRDAKAKLLESVRILTPAEVASDTVRGQYGPGHGPDGAACPGYREEPGVAADSSTETFAALRLSIDNPRWQGVPIYVRSGKRLWKKETAIVVQFKKTAAALFEGTPAAEDLDANQLVFHLQPDQGIELRFQAKTPGHALGLQTVGMRFHYQDAFRATRGTGYETLLYQCLSGSATAFPRSDIVQASWRIVQPVLDAWAAEAARDFPSYEAGSWGPKAAFDLIERDGRRWLEIVNRHVLERVPLFHGCDAVLLEALAMTLEPRVFAPGEIVIRAGETGQEMYLVNRGEVEILDGGGKLIDTLGAGSFFGEIALLLARPRTATVRAQGHCNTFVLEKRDFAKVLRDHPRFAERLAAIALERYDVIAQATDLLGPDDPDAW